MKAFNVNERELIQRWDMKGDIIQLKCTEREKVDGMKMQKGQEKRDWR